MSTPPFPRKEIIFACLDALAEPQDASAVPLPETERPVGSLAVAAGSAVPVEVLSDRELPWDEAMAMRLAYQLHQNANIGCNIAPYRNPTAAGFLAVIRDAYKRTHAPLNAGHVPRAGNAAAPKEKNNP